MDKWTNSHESLLFMVKGKKTEKVWQVLEESLSMEGKIK